MDLFTTDRWAEIDALFEQTLDRPPDERTAFLRAACGDDPALYYTVNGLIESDAAAEQALGESATDFAAHLLDAAAAEQDRDLAPGTPVGPYRIEDELGRGGMGTVYRAARADGTFDKTVALKLVKRGMDTDEVLRRFRYERRILAGLDHPHVARLLDAGAAADGRPYLVMELVEGEPITTYAEAHHLDVEQRLALFEQVAEAVAYAHRHLVVHRDLKPSNVLVREDEEGMPQVKLLDFGIARLLDDGGAQHLDAPRTRLGQRVLTPEYAAPEQRRGEPATTATDVYALGVVLFELLVGRRPAHPGERPSSAAPPERRRALRGDLDTLVGTALHEDPARRYPSAEALLDDLVRRRTNQPLRARPESRAYRARKFLARHRWGAGVAAAGVLALVVFLGVLAVEQRETARERDAAEEVAAFLGDVFAAADPFAPTPERLDTLGAADLLARGAERARRDLGDQPALQARLLSLIGTTYLRLSLHDEARPLLEAALRTRLRLFGPGHEAVAETRQALGVLDQQQGRYAEAEAHLTGALAIYREALGPEHERTLSARRVLAGLYEDVARYDEAEAILRDMAAIQRREGAHDDPEMATTLHTLGLVLRDQERYAEAEPLLREALAIQQAAYGEEHPQNAATLNELGAALRGQGDLDAAEEAYRASLVLWQRLVGDDHRETEIARTHLAELLREQGHFEESVALYSAVLDRARQTAGEDHPGVAIITALLAGVYLDAGRLDEAETAYRDALDRMVRALPSGHVRIARATAGLGATLTAQDRYAEAEAALLEARRQFEAGGHDALRALRALVDLYEAWDRPIEAARWQARASESEE